MENKIFSTRDLTLAATLLTMKFYHANIDIVQEGSLNNLVGYFIFDNSPELQEAETQYKRGLVNVEPKAFMSNIHALKAEVTNLTKSPHFNR